MKDSDLAWLSALIYERPDDFDLRCRIARFDVAAHFDRHDSQAALVVGRSAAVLVFRGTEASRVHVRDLWSNATWPWPTVWQGPGRAHSGYRRHLNMIGAAALEMAEDVAADTPLFVTGHSMGGALATLFAAWYYDDNPGYRLKGLVTFGAPKALDDVAARAIRCPVRRYAIKGDFAPRWPPVLGLAHPCPPIVLAPVDPSHGPLRRHAVWGYVEVLRERAGGSL